MKRRFVPSPLLAGLALTGLAAAHVVADLIGEEGGDLERSAALVGIGAIEPTVTFSLGGGVATTTASNRLAVLPALGMASFVLLYRALGAARAEDKAAMLLPGSVNDQSWNAQGHAGLLALKAQGAEVAFSTCAADALALLHRLVEVLDRRRRREATG